MTGKRGSTMNLNSRQPGKRKRNVLTEFAGRFWEKTVYTLSSPYRFFLFLGSRGFSVFVMSLIIFMFLVWLLPFQLYGVPDQVVRNIATKEWLFRIPYILFFANALACLVRTAPAAWRQVKDWGSMPALSWRQWQERAQQTENHAGWQWKEYIIDAGKAGQVLQKLARSLKLRGYAISPLEGSQGWYARRGKFAPLGSMMLHASFFLVPVALLVSSLYTFYGYAVVTEGQPFYGQNKESYANTVFTGRAELPGISFRLDRVEPVFWQDKLLFTDLAADLAYPADDPARYRTIRLNSPLFEQGVMVGIRGFGYAPYYILKDPGGRVLGESFVNLRIFPPGAEDAFTVEGFPWRVKVSILADAEKKGSGFENRSYNLKRPLFYIKLVKGEGEQEKVFHQQYLWPGDTLNYRGYSLMLPEIRYYGEFSLFYYPAFWLIMTAFVLACLGLITKLLFYRKEFFLGVTAPGRLAWAGRSEYFQDLMEQELEHRWRKDTVKGTFVDRSQNDG